MQRATSIVRKPAVKADKVIDTVVLAHEDRQRRRAVLKDVYGSEHRGARVLHRVVHVQHLQPQRLLSHVADARGHAG